MLSFNKKNQDADIKVPSPPSDSISSLALNGDAQTRTNAMVATSWDNTVSCYELQYDAQNQVNRVVPQSQIRHDAPVLCSDFASDKTTVFSGGADNLIKMWNITQGTTTQTIGQHEAPVKAVKFNADKSLVVSASWDKTVKLWDCRSPTAVATLPFNERIYAMDSKSTALVVATADKMLHVIDLNSGSKLSEFKSTLAHQTRCISMFADSTGFAEGCIEGRIALEYFDECATKVQDREKKTPGLKSFAFKCHRQGDKSTEIYSVNALHFHPRNTFLSAGSDGAIHIWDKDSRMKIVSLDSYMGKVPIIDAKFSAFGNILVYALSYDWSKGASGNTGVENSILVHNLKQEEIMPKKK